MPVKVKRYQDEQAEGGVEFTDPVQRETTVDGQTFAWGPNQTRNFADDGVGVAHAAFFGGSTIVQEDKFPFGTSRS